jgi:isopenicillin N synthase-like dioxygenase
MSEINSGTGPRNFFESGTAAIEIPFEEIPVIDFSHMFSENAEDRKNVGDKVRKACTEIGFFYVSNHQIPISIIKKAFDESARFFDRDISIKNKINVEQSPALRGYTALLASEHDDSGQADFHEGFDLALDLNEYDEDVQSETFGYAPNQWPDDMPGFKTALVQYHSTMVEFGKLIFRSFALALDLDQNYFESAITKPMAHMRVLHYPPQDSKSKEQQVGIGAHSDFECFTILCTDEVPALQVLSPDGNWVHAPPLKGCFIVNVGDLMARWTNNYFKSTVHRAINLSGKKRYSIPFFYGPNSKMVIKTLPTCQKSGVKEIFEPIEAGKYIKSRFDVSYAHRVDDKTK